MGCFSGHLMSSASDQKLFCKLSSPFCCSFDEFVEEKVISPSYSSAILTPLLSVELLIAVLSFFSHLGKASEGKLCAEIENDLILLRVGFEGIFHLIPLGGVSLTPFSLQSVLSGISQIRVSAAPTSIPPSSH